MAARKSCTKLTWGEAKQKCGLGSKNKSVVVRPPQRENHGKLLAAKIVAKGGPDEHEQVRNRQAAKLARKDKMRQEELDRQRAAEKEKKRLEDVARPHDKAMEKLKEVELEFHRRININNKTNAEKKQSKKSSDSNENDPGRDDENEEERNNLVCESKKLQLDEVLALQAIYSDTETLRLSDSSKLDELQSKVDDWETESDQETAQRAVIQHPSLAFTMRRSIEDNDDDDCVAHTLISVTYPNDYPLISATPAFEIVWFLVTRKSFVFAYNKPLESIGILDEIKLTQSMSEYAKDYLLGMPSVYELLDTWLSEHLFEYIDCSK